MLIALHSSLVVFSVPLLCSPFYPNASQELIRDNKILVSTGVGARAGAAAQAAELPLDRRDTALRLRTFGGVVATPVGLACPRGDGDGTNFWAEKQLARPTCANVARVPERERKYPTPFAKSSHRLLTFRPLEPRVPALATRSARFAAPAPRA